MSSDASQSVRYGLSGSVAHVILNRPDKLNAIDDNVLHELREHFASIEEDASVRAVVIRGEGKAFCAGADLTYVSQCVSEGSFGDFLHQWHRTLNLIASCGRPTIAAVQGFALAGGLELSHVCDFVVAANDAVFGDQHSNYDLFPGGGSTQRLMRIVGVRRAKWLLMSGERFTAQDALQWGLVNQAVAPQSLLATAEAIASHLSSRSTSLISGMKLAIEEGIEMHLQEGLSLEERLADEYMAGADALAGLEAFAERKMTVREDGRNPT